MPQPNLLKSFIEADQQASGLAILEGAIRPDRSPKLADEECPVNEHGGVLWSANMALPAEQFRALQGFDEDFPFATMEDMDFFLRAKKRGLRIVWLPGAVVEHPFVRRSGVRRHLQHRYSVLTFVRKHPERLVSIRKGCGLVAILRSVKRRVVDRKWIQPISSYKALMEQVSSTLVLRSTLRDPLRITQEINRLGLCLNLRANGDEKTHSLDVSIPG
jgi:GT2 family glycosyltransferase